MRRPSTRVLAVSLGTVVLLAAAGLLTRSSTFERFTTRFAPPTAAPPASDELRQEREARATLGSSVTGRLVWSSNRSGNHELYVAALDGSPARQLTNHPNVDYFSRFSPDGRLIAFLRSRRPWVSFREIDGWDLYVVEASGGEPRRVAERAYHPAWTTDGSTLVFVRDNKVMAVDVESGSERLVHDGAAPPTGGSIGDPDLSRGTLLAVSLRDVPQDKRGVGVADLEAGSYRVLSSSPSACHVTWAPDGSRVVWIETGGHGGTRVMHARWPGGTAEPLIDLPGPYSHEYFPRVTGDGGWLVWGAAAEGHEHDRADYEVFAWKIGSPWESAVRLTYSKSNDQWPDLLIE